MTLLIKITFNNIFEESSFQGQAINVVMKISYFVIKSSQTKIHTKYPTIVRC